MTIRASAADGSTRASWPVIPGRCSASAASSAAASVAGRPSGMTPSSTSRAARSASGVSTTSWPPKTRSPSSGSPAPVNGSRVVIRPVGSASRAATAAAPVSAVVATDPRLPTSHTPTRPSRAALNGHARNDGMTTKEAFVQRISLSSRSRASDQDIPIVAIRRSARNGSIGWDKRAPGDRVMDATDYKSRSAFANNRLAFAPRTLIVPRGRGQRVFWPGVRRRFSFPCMLRDR